MNFITTTDDSRFCDSNAILESDYFSWLQEKSSLITKMLEGKKIMEVGCGEGSLLKLMSSHDFELTGSDYSNVYLDRAKKTNPNIRFFKADLTDIKSWEHLSRSFDSIICSEVIEHIENDLQTLKIIHSMLKPNGILVLTTPAFNSLYSQYDKKLGHVRRYSKKSICAVIEQAGFHVEKARYWNFLGLFGWLIFFKILKKDLTKVSTNPVFGYILGKWLKLEAIISMPLGQTIIVKARKS